MHKFYTYLNHFNMIRNFSFIIKNNVTAYPTSIFFLIIHASSLFALFYLCGKLDAFWIFLYSE